MTEVWILAAKGFVTGFILAVFYERISKGFRKNQEELEAIRMRMNIESDLVREILGRISIQYPAIEAKRSEEFDRLAKSKAKTAEMKRISEKSAIMKQRWADGVFDRQKKKAQPEKKAAPISIEITD